MQYKYDCNNKSSNESCHYWRMMKNDWRMMNDTSSLELDTYMLHVKSRFAEEDFLEFSSATTVKRKNASARH